MFDLADPRVPSQGDLAGTFIGAILRVLWIDDDRDVQKAFVLFWQKRSVNVTSAYCAASGRRQLVRDAFDAVLLDLKLPDGSGIDLLRQVRADGDNTPVVVFTSFPAVASALEAGRLNVSKYVEKPSSPQALYDHLLAATMEAGERGLTSRNTVIPIEGHVRDRVCALIARGVLASADLPTIAKWGRHVGVAVGTLKSWCAAAQIAPKKALLLTRVLRALFVQQTTGQSLLASLAIVDPRTLRKTLCMADVPTSESGAALISAKEFLVRQQLLTDEVFCGSLLRTLAETLPRTFG